MPFRLSERTSNCKALSTICRFVLRRVSFRALRTKLSLMSMLVLMELLYTILRCFCASLCDTGALTRFGGWVSCGPPRSFGSHSRDACALPTPLSSPRKPVHPAHQIHLPCRRGMQPDVRCE